MVLLKNSEANLKSPQRLAQSIPLLVLTLKKYPITKNTSDKIGNNTKIQILIQNTNTKLQIQNTSAKNIYSIIYAIIIILIQLRKHFWAWATS